MAKSKRESEAMADANAFGGVETADTFPPQGDPITPSVAAEPAVNGTVDEHERRKRVIRRKMRQITYWVCGRKHAADPPRRIMPAPTVGRARKALAVVREMPDYGGLELWIERCVRVE